MRGLLILIFIVLFSCKFFEQDEKKNFTPLSESVIVSELTGISLYLEKSNSSSIAKIPYRTALTLTQLENGDTWRKTTYSGKTGWILYNANLFSNYMPGPKYFQVVARTGLNLRDSPSLESKVKLLLPEEATGEILEGFGSPIQIQDRLGIWLKVNYEKKEGWIFSGFVKIAESLDALNEKQQSGSDYYLLQYDKPFQLKSIDFDESNPELKRAKITKYEHKYYTILDVDYQPTKEEENNCRIETFHRLIFQNKSTGKYYETATYHSEFLSALGNPLPDTVLSTWYGCWCCCPWRGSNLYFLLEDKILMIGYEAEEKSANCLQANVYISQSESQKKYDLVNRKLYLHIKYPDCDNIPEGVDSDLEDTRNWTPTIFPSSVFAVLDFSGGRLVIKRTLNSGIPKEYEEVWKNAINIPVVTPMTKVPY
jgi:hypothetical protein